MSYCHHFEERIRAHPGDMPEHSVIDAHLHIVDFQQQTDGLSVLAETMRQKNIAKAVIFGMPVKKKWEIFEPEEPTYYLDDESKCYYFSATDEVLAEEYEALTREEQDMLLPLTCGFNPTDRSCVRQVEYMLSKYPFWQGIGELLLRHDDLTNLTNEEVARVNHPALFPVYELAAEKNLPVLFHQNASSISLTHGESYKYLPEVEEALMQFPKTRFIWAHCGMSRRVPHDRYAEVLDGLLRRYPNMYCDISWVVYDEVILSHGAPKKHWVELFERYADRFMIGSDLVGHFGQLGKCLSRYDVLARALSKGARNALLTENALAVYAKGHGTYAAVSSRPAACALRTVRGTAQKS